MSRTSVTDVPCAAGFARAVASLGLITCEIGGNSVNELKSIRVITSLSKMRITKDIFVGSEINSIYVLFSVFKDVLKKLILEPKGPRERM